MSSGKISAAIFFLAINVIFSITANACYTCNNPPKPPTPAKGSCPRDALKLGIPEMTWTNREIPIHWAFPSYWMIMILPICAKVLNGTVVGTIVGRPPDSHGCSLLGGLIDPEAALCLCTALKANILGINLHIPIALSLLINTCGKNLPSDFLCA